MTPHIMPANTLDSFPALITHGHIMAAGQSSGGSVGTLLILAVLLAGGYLVACWIWPFRACSKCEGAGRFRSPSGRAWRYCRRCSGRGAQQRIGRRVWAWLKATKYGDQ